MPERETVTGAEYQRRLAESRRDPETGRFKKAEPVTETPEEDPFIAAQRAAEPPPLPKQEEETPAAATVASASTGAKAGGVVGPAGAIAGAIGGGAIGFLLNQAKQQPVGTLEGGGAQGVGDDPGAVLQQLLAVQQKIARVGTPLLSPVKTDAVGSRM